MNALENFLIGFSAVRETAMCRLDICVGGQTAHGDSAIGFVVFDAPVVQLLMKYDVSVDTRDVQSKDVMVVLLMGLNLCG
jgi:hypothetical protein